MDPNEYAFMWGVPVTPHYLTNLVGSLTTNFSKTGSPGQGGIVRKSTVIPPEVDTWFLFTEPLHVMVYLWCYMFTAQFYEKVQRGKIKSPSSHS